MLLLNMMLLGMVIYLYRQNKRCTFTKLLNKAQFNRDIKRYMRRKNDMIILIDIDKFKQINDTHGHAFGDAVIASVSDAVRNSIRFSDRAYRIGGDEFAILTSDASVGDRIKSKLGAASGNISAISISVGCGKTYEEADTAMYLSKRAGQK